MRVLFALQGWPPVRAGASERFARDLARALVECGQDVAVFAGSPDVRPELCLEREQDGGVEVFRLHRSDLYSEHWQKTHAPQVARAFGELLREWRPDVVHVHHWLRLSDDLVLTAARAGLPAVLSLGDHFATCALHSRIDPKTRSACEAAPGPMPCTACASGLPPFTPWVPLEQRFMAMATRYDRLARELRLACVRVVPSVEHAQAMARFSAHEASEFEVLAPTAGENLGARGRCDWPLDQGLLKLGAWGPWTAEQGSDLLLEALRLARHQERIELHLAGNAAHADFLVSLRARAEGLNVHLHAECEEGALDAHVVTDVHAMVNASRAAETKGLVLDEAWRLDLPALLPNAGAFARRAQVGRGACFHIAGSAADLARCMDRFFDEPEFLTNLRAGLGEARASLPTLLRAAQKAQELYSVALSRGAPEGSQLPPDEWFAERMAEQSSLAWDEAMRTTPASQLGLGEVDEAGGPGRES